jgi:hypothetical protein
LIYSSTGKRLKNLITAYEPIELTSDIGVEELMSCYVSSNIIPARYRNDLLHIAYAVANDLDVVVSWNLRHIVKLKTRMEVNGINKVYGYKEIELCTPEEVIEDED